MMTAIDPLDEPLTLAEAAATLPKGRNGARPHASSIWRWAKNGIGGIKLRVRRYGGRTCTCRRWLAEFGDALARAKYGPPEPEPAPEPDHVADERRLDALLRPGTRRGQRR
ncbi:MAG: DUF1580 domain-containing protein [Planctomycetia bacterium]|nr:DUF1580 domain-containing protein [Planctomycetia bacterium]